MRCFIAINIPENMKKAMVSLQQKLSAASGIRPSDVKWVNTNAMHMTLKFLGEVEDTKVADVCNIVKEAVSMHKSFELDIESVGYYGGNVANVLWVGIGEGIGDLKSLQKDIEESLALEGWPEENREFSGHLTLCRIKNSKAGAKLAKLSEEYKSFKLGDISVDLVTVYQSQLMPKGPVYTVLGNYKLQ